MSEIQWYHRIHLPDGSITPGSCIHGPDDEDWMTTRFGLPQDLTGKSVLDIGCYDGAFSFECEKRGALNVYALDRKKSGGFEFAHKALNSKVNWVQWDIEYPSDLAIQILDKQQILVLCYGVLYHLKNPLGAMEILHSLTGGICLLETAISNVSKTPLLEYRPRAEGDPTNYFFPNDAWIELAAKEVGFKECKEIYRLPCGSRATYRLTK